MLYTLLWCWSKQCYFVSVWRLCECPWRCYTSWQKKGVTEDHLSFQGRYLVTAPTYPTSRQEEVIATPAHTAFWACGLCYILIHLEAWHIHTEGCWGFKVRVLDEISNFTKTDTSAVSYLNLFWHLTICTTEMTLHILAVIFTFCCWFVTECHYKKSSMLHLYDISKYVYIYIWVNMSERVSE